VSEPSGSIRKNQIQRKKEIRRKSSDGADVHFYDVVDLHQLLDKKGFAVLYANHLAVMTGEIVHFVFETINGKEDVGFFELAPGFAFIGEELGREGLDGAAALFVLASDINDESGADGREHSGVEDFEGAVRFAFDGELFETGQEAAFVTEGGGVVVVRMASFPEGEDDGFGAKFADRGGDAQLVLAAGVDIGVGYAQSAAIARTQDFCGFGSFLCANFRIAARAHLASGEIKDAGLIAELGHFQKSAATGELHVVGVGGDSEYVHGHGRILRFGGVPAKSNLQARNRLQAGR